MKSAVFTIFKKELKRFFSDKRMCIMTIFLPGIMIFLMYNFMGSAVANIDGTEETAYSICSENMPASIEAILESAGVENVNIEDMDMDEDGVKTAISEYSSFDAFVVFPENFEEAVIQYDSSSGEPAPLIEIYYNSIESSAAYMVITSVLDGYEDSMINKFDINTGNAQYDLASEKDMTGTIFSMLLPMLLLMFLYSGCMAVAVESIAGEKERGTIATMLVTPTKRSHIAIGKIFALSLIALLSGASSATGTFLSLPKLMGGTDMVSGSYYTAMDYVMLAVIILTTVLILVTLISIVSAFARSVKEAQTYVLPIMIIVMVIGISGMFGGAKTETALYMIPLYNSVQSMVGIFSFNINYTNIAVTAATNLACTALGVFILTKIFNSEKIMF